MKTATLLFCTLTLTSLDVAAQVLTGDWKGTSICQIKDSPCHDEEVVYHVSKGHGDNAYHAEASKIINGKEDNMGPLDFLFDPKEQLFTPLIAQEQ